MKSEAFYEAVGASALGFWEWVRRRSFSDIFKPAFWVVSYAAIGLYTFGHVASENYRAAQYEYEQCDLTRAANRAAAYNSCDRPDAILIAPMGVAAGALWPLYLSWELQQ